VSFWTLKAQALSFRKSATARLNGLLGIRGRGNRPKIPNVEASAHRQNRVGIAAIVKNESQYIGEWMQFHALQGVSHFFIYDNGCTDDTLDVARRYAVGTECTIIPWRTFLIAEEHNFSIQALAYAHALCNFGSDFRWMAFIDVDEFLFSPTGEPLPSVLNRLSHLPAIAVPWTNFGSSGHDTKPEGLVIENYTECAPHPLHPKQRSLLRYKSIVDPAEVSGMGSHHFPLKKLGLVSLNERGDVVDLHRNTDPAFVATDRLRLNHYFTRSREEMAQRLAKGRVSRNGQVIENYLKRRLDAYEVQSARDETILQFLPELRRRLVGVEGRP
jgi:hypothetical protein